MKKDVLKVGTLINDNGKIGIISKVIEVGELKPKLAYISWRANYEIMYADGSKLIIGCRALEQMIYNGVVEICSPSTPTPTFLEQIQQEDSYPNPKSSLDRESQNVSEEE
jgi:hypothetical protein